MSLDYASARDVLREVYYGALADLGANLSIVHGVDWPLVFAYSSFPSGPYIYGRLDKPGAGVSNDQFIYELDELVADMRALFLEEAG